MLANGRDSRLDHEQLVRETLLHLLLDDLEPGLVEHLEPLAIGPARQLGSTRPILPCQARVLLVEELVRSAVRAVLAAVLLDDNQRRGVRVRVVRHVGLGRYAERSLGAAEEGDEVGMRHVSCALAMHCSPLIVIHAPKHHWHHTLSVSLAPSADLHVVLDRALGVAQCSSLAFPRFAHDTVARIPANWERRVELL